jgi:hypothetical protein
MLPIDVMDHFRDLFGADPRRFIELPSTELEEIVDALDGQIDVTGDAYDREILSEVQHYALLVIENRGDNEANGIGKPVVRLVGEDGNVFNVIGVVRRALAKADRERGTRTAPEFMARAFDADSYDGVLRLALEYVDVR